MIDTSFSIVDAERNASFLQRWTMEQHNSKVGCFIENLSINNLLTHFLHCDKDILREMGLPFYDPLLIIEKTQGRMAGDDQWVLILKNEEVQHGTDPS